MDFSSGCIPSHSIAATPHGPQCNPGSDRQDRHHSEAADAVDMMVVVVRGGCFSRKKIQFALHGAPISASKIQ